MAVVFPLSAISADMHGAMLFVTKSGMVNGFGVNRSTAVFDGDKLQLPSDSSAWITTSGTSVLISPGSKLAYKSRSVELGNDSGVSVQTTTGVVVNIGKLRIAPAQNEGKFAVARADGSVLVLPKLGTVNIADGSSTATVAEGTSVSIADPESQEPGATPGAAESVGITGKKLAAILIGIGAAGAAALIVLETTKTSASPPRP